MNTQSVVVWWCGGKRRFRRTKKKLFIKKQKSVETVNGQLIKVLWLGGKFFLK
jgi:hypothetical protein